MKIWKRNNCIISQFFFKIENAVAESDRLSAIDENVCILHGNTWNMVLGIDEKYKTLSIYANLANFKVSISHQVAL